MNKQYELKWSWFKVPVKVEQINEYLFSDAEYTHNLHALDDLRPMAQRSYNTAHDPTHPRKPRLVPAPSVGRIGRTVDTVDDPTHAYDTALAQFTR